MDYSSYVDYSQYAQQYSDTYMEQSAAYAFLESISTALMGISVIISLISVVAMWFLFEKAGESGVLSIIPGYGTWKLFEIVYGSGWKCLLLLVPIVNYVVSFMIYIRLAQAYGKGILFGIGMLFFTPIFMLILAFGDARYWGPVSSFI